MPLKKIERIAFEPVLLDKKKLELQLIRIVTCKSSFNLTSSIDF